MLVELNIKNFALIQELSVEFGAGFNILSGETGAGKSILIDTIDYVLGGKFSKDQISHSTQKFPDFVIMDEQTGEKIGIEVKKTNDAKWEVQGGSIFESLKNDIENIYILMGKFGGTIPEARLKRYEECLQDLKVTHSPRFYINLDLKEGEDYLTQKS